MYVFCVLFDLRRKPSHQNVRETNTGEICQENKPRTTKSATLNCGNKNNGQCVAMVTITVLQRENLLSSVNKICEPLMMPVVFIVQFLENIKTY